MKRTDLTLLFFFAPGLASCSFNFELTSQRTALENQIMGSYMEIDDDLIVTRLENEGLSSDKPQQRDRRDNVALQRAIRNRAFNADDINELKDGAILGEDADGRVVITPKNHPARQQATPEQIRLAEALIDEENRDRALIWSNELAKTEDGKPTDLIVIKQNFVRQIYESAPKGQWFYRDQKWQQKQ